MYTDKSTRYSTRWWCEVVVVEVQVCQIGSITGVQTSPVTMNTPGLCSTGPSAVSAFTTVSTIGNITTYKWSCNHTYGCSTTFVGDGSLLFLVRVVIVEMVLWNDQMQPDNMRTVIQQLHGVRVVTLHKPIQVPMDPEN